MLPIFFGGYPPQEEGPQCPTPRFRTARQAPSWAPDAETLWDSAHIGTTISPSCSATTAIGSPVMSILGPTVTLPASMQASSRRQDLSSGYCSGRWWSAANTMQRISAVEWTKSFCRSWIAPASAGRGRLYHSADPRIVAAAGGSAAPLGTDRRPCRHNGSDRAHARTCGALWAGSVEARHHRHGQHDP
jgi:hypothetical protein